MNSPRRGPDPRGFRLPDRSHTPRMISGPFPAIGPRLADLPVNGQCARPAARLGDPLSVGDHAGQMPGEGRRFEVRRDVAFELEIEGEGRLVGLAAHPKALEPLDHLDLDRADRGVEPVAPQLSRASEHGLPTISGEHRERVGHSEVRVLAHAHDQEEGAGRIVDVEVVAVIEVAVACKNPIESLRDLMGQVVVHRGQHRPHPPRSRNIVVTPTRYAPTLRSSSLVGPTMPCDPSPATSR